MKFDNIPLQYQHWRYVWFPIVAAGAWFSTLLAMLITYLVQGRPRYTSMEPDGTIAYISDVGADMLKPLFVTGSAITAVFFFLSLVAERWLRHSGRLHPNNRRRERVYSILSAFGAFMGGAGLILLAVFDTRRYPTLHRLFLLIFILGVTISAVFTIVEYRWIVKGYKGEKFLRRTFWAKVVITVILVVLSILFGVALFQGGRFINAGAIIEWVISFGFTFYLLTFYFDLRQSKGVARGQLHEFYHTGRGSTSGSRHVSRTSNHELTPTPEIEGTTVQTQRTSNTYETTARTTPV